MKDLSYRRIKTPPVFHPELWEGFLKTSCYAYALNLKMNEFVLVGEFLGERCDQNMSNKKMIEVLKKEVEFLGFSIKEVGKEYIPKEKEFLIYFKRNQKLNGYHFLRQDTNKMWSHKFHLEYPSHADFWKKEYVEEGNEWMKGWFFVLRRKDR